MDSKQFFYKNNRLQQLKGFYYTVQKKGVSNAAKHLNLTQSAISNQIASLEKSLQTKLFERKNRSLVLTESGKMLYEMSIEPIHSLENIYELFAENKDKSTKYIDISANHASILYILPNIINKYKELYPDTEIMIRNISRKEASHRLMNNETDICIYPYVKIPEECEFYHIKDYDPILMLRADHPLAKNLEINLKEVTEYDVIRIDPELITLPHFEQVMKIYKLGSKITFENGDWEILKSLVTAKAGLAIISDICLTKKDNDLVGLSLAEYFPKMSYGFTIKKGMRQRKAVLDFIEIIKNTHNDD